MRRTVEPAPLPAIPVGAAVGVFVMTLLVLGAAWKPLEGALTLVVGLLALSALVGLFVHLGRDQRRRRAFKIRRTFVAVGIANGFVRDGKTWKLSSRIRLTRAGLEFDVEPPLGIDLEAVAKRSGALALGWSVHNVVVVQAKNLRHLTLNLTVNDLLADRIDYNEFRQRHSVEYRLDGPVAIDSEGQPFDLRLTHVLICGRSGAGKSSALLSVLSLAFDAPTDGPRPILYGIDPKIAEIAGGPARHLFDQVATEPAQIAALIHDVYEIVLARRGMSCHDRAPVFLVIDELVTVLAAGGDRKLAAAIEHDILEIERLGRSHDVYLIATSLVVTKDVIGKLRDGFFTKIALALPNASDVDVLLGPGSREAGALADKIEPSLPPDYATSGVGYILGEYGNPRRVRFPLVTDNDIYTWIGRRTAGELVGGTVGVSAVRK